MFLVIPIRVSCSESKALVINKCCHKKGWKTPNLGPINPNYTFNNCFFLVFMGILLYAGLSGYCQLWKKQSAMGSMCCKLSTSIYFTICQLQMFRLIRPAGIFHNYLFVNIGLYIFYGNWKV